MNSPCSELQLGEDKIHSINVVKPLENNNGTQEEEEVSKNLFLEGAGDPHKRNPKLQINLNKTNKVTSIFPQGGRLQQFSIQWRQQVLHQWPVSVITQGYQLQWNRTPRPLRYTPMEFTQEEQMAVDEAVQKFLSSGSVGRSPSQNKNYLSNFFAVQKPTKCRPILNCTKLNQYIHCHHFKMEGVPALREIIEKTDYICKIDLKDALQIPISRIWIECSSKNFLKNYEICLRTSQGNSSSLCLLLGRDLCTSQDERREDELYPTNDSSLRSTGISNQQGEEYINPEQSTIIPRFSIRYLTDVDSSSKGKNPKTGGKDSTTIENYKTSIMQVDSELDWENNSDDTGSRRSTSPCQIYAKGFSEGTLKFKPQLGISLPPEHNKPSRIDMVDKQCTSQERASDTIQAAKPRYHHLRRCIGFRLGSQFSVCTNRRLLDKKRKRRKSKPSQSTEVTSIRMVLTNEMVQIPPIQVEEIPDRRICTEAQQEIEEALEPFSRPRSTSSECIQPEATEERTLFKFTMESNSKSVAENTGRPSQRSDSDHTIVANPILVESSTEDETTSNTSSNVDQSQMDIDRMDVIFKKRIKEGLTIQGLHFFNPNRKSEVNIPRSEIQQVWIIQHMITHVRGWSQNEELDVAQLQKKTVIWIGIATMMRPPSDLGRFQYQNLEFKWSDDGQLLGFP
ncbi:hypothetical protein G6F36_011568 [Rhizopus arrhizus]|nr:hypothetical protein G6F36_011568 [Rhizopus arrhizus]